MLETVLTLSLYVASFSVGAITLILIGIALDKIDV
jgi:hypothetical protein